MVEKITSTFSRSIFFPAIGNAFKKLNPIALMGNPVMFITEIGAITTTVEAIVSVDLAHLFSLHVAIWLWFTVLFANFAEAIAESRNRAQADALKKTRQEIQATKIEADGTSKQVSWRELKKNDIVIVKAGEIIPSDGEIIDGAASIDESEVTGESAHVIKAAGTDKDAVISGTKVISDQIKIRVTSNPGETFLDKMIALIEGAKRKKTLNEIALTILLSGLTFIFLAVIVSLKIFGFYLSISIPLATLAAFLVCLIPTTIAGLLTAIGIAGINRLMLKNVIALSGQAVEAAGDVNLILFDKTGTITEGNRLAVEIIPAQDATINEMASLTYLSSFDDTTTEGRSIIELIKTKYPQGIVEVPNDAKFIPFSATTRLSGTDFGNQRLRKGSKGAIESLLKQILPPDIDLLVKGIASQGGTPLVVASSEKVIGVIFLKDVIKPGLKEKFSRFRAMGIKTVMMTGDNEITAKTIAKEVGVDDFLSEISPEGKLHYLQYMQDKGLMVAMTGDGVNDAPALAYANVGVAMNAGSQAAKEAGNMIDLDSNPTKLFDIIEIGKQMLMTRGALTTFSIANDISKYFAIMPAILTPYFPFFEKLNIMRLSSPDSAVLSAVIFNAWIIVALIPLAFRGIKVLPRHPLKLLKRNLLIYGVGGIILPFIGIKLIDMLMVYLKS